MKYCTQQIVLVQYKKMLARGHFFFFQPCIPSIDVLSFSFSPFKFEKRVYSSIAMEKMQTFVSALFLRYFNSLSFKLKIMHWSSPIVYPPPQKKTKKKSLKKISK